MSELAAGVVGLLLGVVAGRTSHGWIPRLRAWWRVRELENKTEGWIRGAKERWGLDAEEEEAAELAAERWTHDRCVFCGREPNEGPRCDAQVDYAIEQGRPTWEEPEFDTVLTYIFPEKTETRSQP